MIKSKSAKALGLSGVEDLDYLEEDEDEEIEYVATSEHEGETTDDNKEWRDDLEEENYDTTTTNDCAGSGTLSDATPCGAETETESSSIQSCCINDCHHSDSTVPTCGGGASSLLLSRQSMSDFLVNAHGAAKDLWIGTAPAAYYNMTTVGSAFHHNCSDTEDSESYSKETTTSDSTTKSCSTSEWKDYFDTVVVECQDTSSESELPTTTTTTTTTTDHLSQLYNNHYERHYKLQIDSHDQQFDGHDGDDYEYFDQADSDQDDNVYDSFDDDHDNDTDDDCTTDDPATVARFKQLDETDSSVAENTADDDTDADLVSEVSLPSLPPPPQRPRVLPRRKLISRRRQRQQKVRSPQPLPVLPPSPSTSSVASSTNDDDDDDDQNENNVVPSTTMIHNTNNTTPTTTTSNAVDSSTTATTHPVYARNPAKDGGGLVKCFSLSDDPLSSIIVKESKMLWGNEHSEDDDNNNGDIKKNKHNLEEQVIVAVEATAISDRDVAAARKAEFKAARNNDTDDHDQQQQQQQAPSFLMGCTFVGVIHQSGPVANATGFEPGKRVASIAARKWGNNSKYVTIPATQLRIVPKQLDAAEIAALLASYLPAFQALHHGRAPPHRYSNTALNGRKVLVTGGATLQVRAVVQLARSAGAAQICVAAPQDHWKALRSLRNITLLEENPKEWQQQEYRKHYFDVVVHYNYPKHFAKIQKLIARKGRLVCVSKSKQYNHNSSSIPAVEAAVEIAHCLKRFYESYQLSMVKRASLYDFEESMELNPEAMENDVDCLLQLLEARKIRPSIERLITLSDIPQAHQDLLSMRPLRGAIVCEPWKE